MKMISCSLDRFLKAYKINAEQVVLQRNMIWHHWDHRERTHSIHFIKDVSSPILEMIWIVGPSMISANLSKSRRWAITLVSKALVRSYEAVCCCWQCLRESSCSWVDTVGMKLHKRCRRWNLKHPELRICKGSLVSFSSLAFVVTPVSNNSAAAKRKLVNLPALTILSLQRGFNPRKCCFPNPCLNRTLLLQK